MSERIIPQSSLQIISDEPMEAAESSDTATEKAADKPQTTYNNNNEQKTTYSSYPSRTPNRERLVCSCADWEIYQWQTTVKLIMRYTMYQDFVLLCQYY